VRSHYPQANAGRLSGDSSRESLLLSSNQSFESTRLPRPSLAGHFHLRVIFYYENDEWTAIRKEYRRVLWDCSAMTLISKGIGGAYHHRHHHQRSKQARVINSACALSTAIPTLNRSGKEASRLTDLTRRPSASVPADFPASTPAGRPFLKARMFNFNHIRCCTRSFADSRVDRDERICGCTRTDNQISKDASANE
jgi:hypothetical protein